MREGSHPNMASSTGKSLLDLNLNYPTNLWLRSFDHVFESSPAGDVLAVCEF